MLEKIMLIRSSDDKKCVLLLTKNFEITCQQFVKIGVY